MKKSMLRILLKRQGYDGVKKTERRPKQGDISSLFRKKRKRVLVVGD